MKSIYNYIIVCLMLGVYACASLGTPDGGPFDEIPPKFVKSTPRPNATLVKSNKVTIEFDEFVKLENPAEKVIISPPQSEAPEIRVAGKDVVVEFMDTLKANTTYTIDFGDAIVDNNEGNPLGNFTFAFATGNKIDTMEVSGYVLDASNLEPIKGIQVGLHKNLADSAFKKLPFYRISRTDASGHFTIRGIAPGKYHIFALQDGNQNFIYDSKIERIAFQDSLIIPSSMPATRMDSVFSMRIDSLRFDSLKEVHYTRFLPDDIVLRAFREKPDMQYLARNERPELNRFWLKFNMPVDSLPQIAGLNFDAEHAFVVEMNHNRDSLVYWLKDSLLCEQDTLRFQIRYQATDSLGKWIPRTDTLQMLNKIPLKRRLYLAEEARKKADEARKKAVKESARNGGDMKNDTVATQPKRLEIETNIPGSLELGNNLSIAFKEPLAHIDTAGIKLFQKVDTLFTPVPMIWEADSIENRKYNILAEWKPGETYKVVVDSATFTGLYGLVNEKIENTVQVKKLEEYGNLFLQIQGVEGPVIVELLDNNDVVIARQSMEKDHTCNFYFLSPKKYYIRLFVDKNGNGIWDPGKYDTHLEPEEVYYFPKTWEIKANFDFEETWNVHDKPLHKQKLDEIKKQKPETVRKRRDRNRERARKKGGMNHDETID